MSAEAAIEQELKDKGIYPIVEALNQLSKSIGDDVAELGLELKNIKRIALSSANAACAALAEQNGLVFIPVSSDEFF